MKEHTGYWTFFCNPKKWYIDEFILSGEVEDAFTIADFHKGYFQKGQYGVIRVGHDTRTLKELAGKARLERGIYAIVEVLDTPKLMKYNDNDFWSDNTNGDELRYKVRIRYLKTLLENPILLEELSPTKSEYDQHLVKGQQASTMPLNREAFYKIIDLVGGHESLSFNSDKGSPENVEEDILLEGAKKQITVNAYERNPLARKRCLEYYGYDCSVCNFNFYEEFGEIGKDYIHVHHVEELSEIDREYRVDPIKDLRPVCPNCHAMLHQKSPAYEIEELKEIKR